MKESKRNFGGFTMAMVSCPECGKQVSDRAAACPNCGCPIAGSTQSTGVRILIEQHPDLPGTYVPIKDLGGKKLCEARAGSAVTLNISEPTIISLCGQLGVPMLDVRVTPGKKYKAVWGMGFLQARITSCHEVDII